VTDFPSIEEIFWDLNNEVCANPESGYVSELYEMAETKSLEISALYDALDEKFAATLLAWFYAGYLASRRGYEPPFKLSAKTSTPISQTSLRKGLLGKDK
jgi:hypothetical protein